MDPWLVQKLLSECVTAAAIISLDHPVGSLVTFLFVRRQEPYGIFTKSICELTVLFCSDSLCFLGLILGNER